MDVDGPGALVSLRGGGDRTTWLRLSVQLIRSAARDAIARPIASRSRCWILLRSLWVASLVATAVVTPYVESGAARRETDGYWQSTGNMGTSLLLPALAVLALVVVASAGKDLVSLCSGKGNIHTVTHANNIFDRLFPKHEECREWAERGDCAPSGRPCE